MDTLIIFLVNISFIILSLFFYHLLTKKYPISKYKKILIIIDITFLIVNMLVLLVLVMLALYLHYAF